MPLKARMRARASSSVFADGAAVADLEVDDDLVAAEGVEALDSAGGRHRQLTSVPGAAVVVEDDLSVEVFESGHGQVNSRSASSSASLRASTSASSLYTYTDARAVAPTPRRRISGLAQW